jgi:hypothetical protein
LVDHAWRAGSGDFTLLKFYGFSRYTSSALHFWPLIVVSALGAGWLLVVTPEAWALPSVRAFVALAALACVGVPLIALDETRITAGILWAPLLLTSTIIVRRLSVEDLHGVLRRISPAALLLVVVVVWDGSLVYPGWKSLWTLLGYLAGNTPIPVSP